MAHILGIPIMEIATHLIPIMLILDIIPITEITGDGVVIIRTTVAQLLYTTAPKEAERTALAAMVYHLVVQGLMAEHDPTPELEIHQQTEVPFGPMHDPARFPGAVVL